MEKQTLKEKRGQKRVREILDAAQEVILEKGYYGATVNDIAERALITKFTLYRYFDSKDAILNAILSRGYSILTGSVNKHIKDIADPRERLHALIHSEFEFFEKRKDFFQMLFVEKLDFESEVKNSVLPSYLEHLLFIKKEIRAGVKKGCFRFVDAEDAAYMLFATLRAFALRWLFQGMKGNLTDKTDSVYNLVIRCLEAEQAGKKRQD